MLYNTGRDQLECHGSTATVSPNFEALALNYLHDEPLDTNRNHGGII